MLNKSRITLIFLGITVLSFFLRLSLVLVNRDANDNHMAVVSYILNSNSLPTASDCRECFQPKLYYFTVAKTIQFFGKLISHSRKVIVAEFINFLAGLVTLLIIWKFITGLSLRHERIKILAYILVAFNPKLIGINSQATNDTFAIMFSTLTIYSSYLFLKKPKTMVFILIVLSTVLGISSKSNTMVTACTILLCLLIHICIEKSDRIRMAIFSATFLFAVPILCLINPFGQYRINYQKYGSPIVMNMEKQAAPYLFIKTVAPRPGILSVQDGFFTFKFIDLLRYPRIDNGNDYAPNRTSLWTQLYGRAYSVHFDNWPASWSSSGENYFNLTRLIFILALIPTFLLLMGAIGEVVILIPALIKRNRPLMMTKSYGLFAWSFWGYIAFIILFVYTYRDFSCMKVIFIYPTILAFPLLFIQACERIYDYSKKNRKWITYILEIGCGTLTILFILDVVLLILHL